MNLRSSFGANIDPPSSLVHREFTRGEQFTSSQAIHGELQSLSPGPLARGHAEPKKQQVLRVPSRKLFVLLTYDDCMPRKDNPPRTPPSSPGSARLGSARLGPARKEKKI